MQGTVSEGFVVGLQIGGLLAIIAGIVLQIVTGAEAGHIVVTAGSVIICAGALMWVRVLRLRK